MNDTLEIIGIVIGCTIFSATVVIGLIFGIKALTKAHPCEKRDVYYAYVPVLDNIRLGNDYERAKENAPGRTIITYQECI